MHVTKALLLSAFAAFAAAQSDVLFFTRVPNPITDGEPAVLLWSTDDTETPVTLTLRRGNADDLDTVYVITDNAQDGQYIWTPSEATPNGDDYALEISQGEEVNYFGPFTIQGASPEAVSSRSASISASISRSISVSRSISASVAANATMPMGTGTGGSTMSRNATMTGRTTTTKKTTVGGGGGSGGQATRTGASPSSSSSEGAAADYTLGTSSLGLLFGAAAGLLYLQ